MRKYLPVMFLLITLACNLPVGGRAPATPNSQDMQGSSPENTIPRITDPAASTPLTIVPIPVREIRIDEEPYQGYQAPGDPFRFVCPSPCPIDPELIYAQYAGFRSAHEILIRLIGVDTLPELQPVDIHIANDGKCGKLEELGNLAYAIFDDNFRAYACTFIFEYSEGAGGTAYSPEDAVRLDRQAVLIHEYLHTVFFGRTSMRIGAFHDFVTPVALYVWDERPEDDFFCDYHPQTPPGDMGGYLLQELCRRNGLTWEKLALSLVELDRVYQSGEGKLEEGFQHPVPSMVQLRESFNRVLGSDTAQAFIHACWPSNLFGEEYTLPAACTDRTPEPVPTIPS
jgi:hypothetical protein